MNDKFYEDLIENGKKMKNGTIRIIIPCSPLVIRDHNDYLNRFLKDKGYKLINLQYHDRVRKLLGYIKKEETK